MTYESTTSEIKVKFTKDSNRCPILRIEAGINGIGPTYDLYFLTLKKDKITFAKDIDKIDGIIIRPNIGMGLYDDWEENYGVSWGTPLEDFKKRHANNG